VALFRNHLCCQRNVGGNHQITCLQCLHNMIIRHVETRLHLDAFHIQGWRSTQGLVGYQRGADFHAFGSAEQDFLDHVGAGVGIDPDLHGGSP